MVDKHTLFLFIPTAIQPAISDSDEWNNRHILVRNLRFCGICPIIVNYHLYSVPCHSKLMNIEKFLSLAQQQADISKQEGGQAIGAILAKSNELVASAFDKTLQLRDPIAIAELECIRNAGRRKDYSELTLFSTHFPTMLVAGVVIEFGIGQLITGDQGHRDSSVALLLASKQVQFTTLSLDLFKQ